MEGAEIFERIQIWSIVTDDAIAPFTPPRQ